MSKAIRCKACGAKIAMLNDDGQVEVMCNHRNGATRCKTINVIGEEIPRESVEEYVERVENK